MIEGEICKINLRKNDSALSYCDSAKMELNSKFVKAQNIIGIHEQVEKGQVKEIEKQRRKKVIWRKIGVAAIFENLLIGFGIYWYLK